MYYEDQSRRFNLASGLLSGAVLGAGLALILLPDRGRQREIRRAAGRAGRSATRRIGELRGGLADTVQEAVHAGRGRFRS
ncbi:MAG TPA: hypothetical protein VHG51_16895 [Longimicrobiaceae bacterium]|nr:hypothetical protein [Longimicrobiaceae bacterium]